MSLPEPLPRPAPTRSRGDFDAACRRARVAPGDTDALWELHVGDARRAGWDLESLLADHALWVEFLSARDGDARAAEAFHSRWTRYVAGFADGRLAREEVRELTARFFERTLRLVAGSFRWQCPFGVYLRAVVVNLARDAWSAARSARERDAPLSDAAELDGEGGADVGWTRRVTSPELLAIQGDRESRLRDAFTRLAESDRRLVAAMLVEGRDGRDVARELGIDRQAVYQRLHRAKEKLRRILGEAGSGGGTRTAARPSVPAAQGAAP